MEKRTLVDGFRVSALGLGCMGMSEFYGPRDDANAMQALAAAVDLGIDFFDTADMYGPHHNEILLGQFLRQHRADVKIATKFGIVREPGQYSRRIDNSPAYARRCCEASLRRLGVERIDLYYVHRIEKDRPIEETIGGLADLISEGKIDRIGLCEVSEATLRRAHAVHPITAVQTEYSLWSRDVERAILPTCRELDIGFVPYSPLGRGFLTGRFQGGMDIDKTDFRNALPRFQDGAVDANRRLVDVVLGMAADKGCSPAQLALAWLLAKGDDIVPIPGTKRVSYLRDNAGAVDVRLSVDDVARLEAAVHALPVVGARYTDEGMKGVDV
ncbi:aldo/keto reductase [Paracoccus sp. (in: a-proteobacteria)]|uniref:aldo/keto reductase n=1 Tax=Paracoccus sp. TaxID=267 RepID=UPI0026DF3B88|nr:aldo/keto reductase [Paracoccus sp. (in: a-proteobacteria)]MDO5646597.1 aldo/keto reductase [Paracoccus sp. (in: a-proteobacteria)]